MFSIPPAFTLPVFAGDITEAKGRLQLPQSGYYVRTLERTLCEEARQNVRTSGHTEGIVYLEPCRVYVTDMPKILAGFFTMLEPDLP